MRKLTIFVLVLLGTLLVVGWRAAPSSHATALANSVGNGNVVGSYAFLDTYQDPMTGTPAGGQSNYGTGQVGAAAGTLTFDGAGHLTGVYSQNTRGCNSGCGYLQVTRVPMAGTYVVYPDGSATLNLCLHIRPTDVNPPQAEQWVHAIWEGSFSTFFVHFRYIQTQLGDCNPLLPPSPMNPSPNVMNGTADKV